uniref:Receptor-type tyrosine-protein phosphatase C n=1 Tax=Talaromyces marneffei PM1 TaxID=1077442 RepID=A0A093VSL7_TALMA
MLSFVPVSLVATATLFSAAQGIEILKPADGDTVDAGNGFDVVWLYTSADPSDWEILLANPAPTKLLATDVIVSPISGTATSTATHHIPSVTGIPDGNYRVIMDPRNKGIGAFPGSGEFTIVNGGAGSTTTTGATTGTTTSTGIGTSPTPPLSQTSTTTTSSSIGVVSSSSSPIIAPSTPTPKSTGSTTSVTSIPTGATVSSSVSVPTGSNRIITTSTSFSTFTSGSVTSLIPESTIVKTIVVPASDAARTSTGSGTSSPTIGLAAGSSTISSVGLMGSVVSAILGIFIL